MSAAENVLGSIIIGGKDAYWRVADVLRPEDFPTPKMANLYRLCGDIAKSSADLDVVTLSEAAERQRIGEFGWVIGLGKDTASAANIRGHAEIVKRDSVERRVRAICAEGAKSGDVATVQAQLSALLNAQPAHAVPAADALKRMWADVMARYAAGDALAGIPTGFPLVDEMTGGLQRGRVYGIGARAKMGKTMFAMNICAKVALAGVPVGVWSLEMSDEELMQRMACAIAGVQSKFFQRPKMFDHDETAMPRLHDATANLRDAPLYISDRTDVSIEEIEAQARQMHAAGRLDLLCIDYLGLLRMPKADRQDLAIAHITRRCKIIAKELRIPVLLVFQLNRGSETNGAVRAPRPSDARDSGAIEQDLDAMFLLHRPSVYSQKAATGLRLDLAAQRNGPTGLIHLDDDLACCRFTGGTDAWIDPTQISTGEGL